MSASRRLLVFGINYVPEPTGTALNTTWQTEALSELGWDVTVVAGVPHYPMWKRLPAPAREWNGTVEVIRRNHYVPRRPTTMARGLYELTWALSAYSQTRVRRSVDLALGIVPSFGGAVLARAAARRHGVPYALLFQDIIGKAAALTGMSTAARVAPAISRLEVRLACGASRVGVVAEGFRDYFVAGGVEPDRIMRLRNPARLGVARETRDAVRKRLGWRLDQFVVIHTGSIGYKQGLETVVRAAEIARDDAGLLFVLQGHGNRRDALEEYARSLGLTNISFLPLAPEDEFPGILEGADAALLNQRGSVQNMSMPAKLASYYLARLPVIAAVSDNDEVAREVQMARAGLVAKPDNAEQLLMAISELRADPSRARRLGEAGRAFADDVLTPEAAIAGVNDFLELALAESR